MNTIDRIKEIINSSVPDSIKMHRILIALSNDENAIPSMLRLLELERNDKKQLLIETNAMLSKAAVVAEYHGTPEQIQSLQWLLSEIKGHYEKYKDKITCCFNLNI